MGLLDEYFNKSKAGNYNSQSELSYQKREEQAAKVKADAAERKQKGLVGLNAILSIVGVPVLSDLVGKIPIVGPALTNGILSQVPVLGDVLGTIRGLKGAPIDALSEYLRPKTPGEELAGIFSDIKQYNKTAPEPVSSEPPKTLSAGDSTLYDLLNTFRRLQQR